MLTMLLAPLVVASRKSLCLDSESVAARSTQSAYLPTGASFGG